MGSVCSRNYAVEPSGQKKADTTPPAKAQPVDGAGGEAKPAVVTPTTDTVPVSVAPLPLPSASRAGETETEAGTDKAGTGAGTEAGTDKAVTGAGTVKADSKGVARAGSGVGQRKGAGVEGGVDEVGAAGSDFAKAGAAQVSSGGDKRASKGASMSGSGFASGSGFNSGSGWSSGGTVGTSQTAMERGAKGKGTGKMANGVAKRNQGGSARVVAAKSSRTVRVFLSSTFRDFQKERDEVNRVVLPALKHLCAERGLFFVPIDLRWGITSEEAHDGMVLERCMCEIDRSTYFVGMYGERYGWHQSNPDVPDELLTATFDRACISYPWMDSMRDRSVTELEFRQGALNHPEEARPFALFYFRSAEYLQSVPDDERPMFECESPDAARRLNALKDEVRQGGFVCSDNYPTPAAVAQTLLADLTRLIDHDFPQVEGSHDGFGGAAADDQAHQAMLDCRTRLYVPHHPSLRRLSELLVERSPPRPVCVTGTPGGGKTALLANWTRQYQTLHPHDIIFVHVICSSNESSSPPSIIRRLLSTMSTAGSTHADALLKLPNDALMTEFLNSFHHAVAELRKDMLMVIDALDQLAPQECQSYSNVLTWLPAVLHPRLRVLTSSNARPVTEEVRSRGWELVEVYGLEAEQVSSLASQYLGFFGKRIEAQHMDRIVSAPPSRCPLYLRTLLDELKLHGQFETLERKISNLLEASSVQDLYALILLRWEQDFPGARTFLSSVRRCRQGLSEPEARSLAGLDGCHREWSTMFLALRDNLVFRGPLLAINHQILAQAVDRRYLSTPELVKAEHSRLADFFLSQPDSGHKARELPWQLQRSERWDDLANYLERLSVTKTIYNHSPYELLGYWNALAAHGKDITYHYSNALSKKGTIQEEASNLNVVGMVLHTAGQYQTALDLLRRAVELKEQYLGPNSLELADCLYVTAVLLQEQHELEAASAMYRRAMEIRQRQLGENHPDVATILNGLAGCLKSQGHNQEAAVMYERALRLREASLGPNHRLVSKTLNDLGLLYKQLGRLSEAQTMYEKSIHIKEATLGPNDPELAASLNNLAVLFEEIGKDTEAQMLYERLLNIEETSLGPDHPRLATSLNNLAVMLKRQGRIDEARALYERALRIQSAHLGEDHVEVATSCYNLGALLETAGDLPMAEEMYRRALGIRERVLGPSHPDLCTVLVALACVAGEKGDLAGARALYERAIGIGDNPDPMTPLNNLATLLFEAGDVEASEGLYRRALDVAGPADRAAALANLAQAVRAREKWDECYALFKECWERASAEDKPALVVQSLSGMAAAAKKLGRSAEALQLHEKILRLREEMLGPDHEEIARSLNSIAVLLEGARDFARAKECYVRALRIIVRALGPTHSDTVFIAGNLADLLHRLGDIDEEMELRTSYNLGAGEGIETGGSGGGGNDSGGLPEGGEGAGGEAPYSEVEDGDGVGSSGDVERPGEGGRVKGNGGPMWDGEREEA